MPLTGPQWDTPLALRLHRRHTIDAIISDWAKSMQQWMYLCRYEALKSRRGRKTNNENVINYVGVTLMRIPWCQITYRKLQFGIARSTYPARRRQSLLLAHKLIVHKAPSPSIDLLSLKSTLGQEHPTGLPRDASTISVQYSTQWLGGFTRQPADWLQIKGNRLKLTN